MSGDAPPIRSDLTMIDNTADSPAAQALADADLDDLADLEAR